MEVSFGYIIDIKYGKNINAQVFYLVDTQKRHRRHTIDTKYGWPAKENKN